MMQVQEQCRYQTGFQSNVTANKVFFLLFDTEWQRTISANCHMVKKLLFRDKCILFIGDFGIVGTMEIGEGRSIATVELPVIVVSLVVAVWQSCF